MIEVLVKFQLNLECFLSSKFLYTFQFTPINWYSLNHTTQSDLDMERFKNEKN
jgi:hypothetical protein